MSIEGEGAAHGPAGQWALLALAAFFVVVAVLAAAVCAVCAAFLFNVVVPVVPVPPEYDILFFSAVLYLASGFGVGVPACILAVHTTSKASVAKRWNSGRKIAVAV